MLHIWQLIHNALSKVEFKNIIFDLGGVLLNLDVSKTHEAFSKLSGIKTVEIYNMLAESSLFLDYEKGLLSDSDFRNEVSRALSIHCSDEIFDNAWNAMLGDLPKPRINLLYALKKEYPVFLLSNTNNIHLTNFSEKAKKINNGSPLDDCFTKAYYSHLLKMRKPDAEIFEHVLSQHNLDPQQTIFLDDNLFNLEGANKLGIKTFHVQHPDMIFTLFV